MSRDKRQGLIVFRGGRIIYAASSAVRENLGSLLLARELISEDELLGNLVLLFIAGHETTTNLIGNGMLTLLRHPGQLSRLRADPALMQTAVEEMLRFEGSVNVIARHTVD